MTELSKDYLALREYIGIQIADAYSAGYNKKPSKILVYLARQHVSDMEEFIATAIVQHYVSGCTLEEAVRIMRGRPDGAKYLSGGRLDITVQQKPWPTRDGYYVSYVKDSSQGDCDMFLEDVTPCEHFLAYLEQEKEKARRAKHADDWVIVPLIKDGGDIYALKKINLIHEALPTGEELVAMGIPIDSKVGLQRVVIISGNSRLAPLTGKLVIKGTAFIEWAASEETYDDVSYPTLIKALKDIPDEHAATAEGSDIYLGYVGTSKQLPVLKTEATAGAEVTALARPFVYGIDGYKGLAEEPAFYASWRLTPDLAARWHRADGKADQDQQTPMTNQHLYPVTVDSSAAFFKQQSMRAKYMNRRRGSIRAMKMR